MQDWVVRLLIGWFGPVAVVGGSFAFVAVVSVVLGGFVFVCMGVCCGFAVLDGATARSVQVTVTGHHWARSIEVLEAEDAPGGVRWRTRAPETLDGDDLSPRWPVVRDDGCAWAGCQRPGARRETYWLRVRLPDGTATQCVVPESSWPRFEVGTQLTGTVGGVSGVLSCGTASPSAPAEREPASAPEPKRRGRGRR